MKRGHVRHGARQRTPNKRTQAQAGQLGARIQQQLAGLNPEQLMALVEQMVQPSHLKVVCNDPFL